MLELDENLELKFEIHEFRLPCGLGLGSFSFTGLGEGGPESTLSEAARWR